MGGVETAEARTCASDVAECLVCGARESRPLHGKTDGLWVCRCGLVFVHPLPTAAEISAREDDAFHGGLIDETAEMFTAYYRNYPEDPVVQGFRATVQRLHQLVGGGTLVDVGIGTGLLLHLAEKAGFRAIGCEIAADAAARAHEEFGVEVRVGDFLEERFDEPVDAITMADVVEHTRNPRRFLEQAASVLRPGGALFVAVPNHRSTLYWAADVLARLPGLKGQAQRLYVPNHYWYFTPKTLARLVAECGFEVREVRRESPYLGRYAFSLPVKLGLATLITLGRWAGLEARVEVYAVRR
ncbi:MAG: class I SAM-dependent methyltransferase [Deltaproteobacteria bacterium]|nr:class I SAM-dependent methyltransferase [Deltaproteobacteria bacterium]